MVFKVLVSPDKTFLRSLQNQGQGNSEITQDIVKAFKTQYLSSKKVRFVERDRKTEMFYVWNPVFPVSDFFFNQTGTKFTIN